MPAAAVQAKWLATATAQPRRPRPARHSAGASAHAPTVCSGPRATPAAAARAVWLAAAAAQPRDDAARRSDQRHAAAPPRPARVPALGVARASCLRAAPALFRAARRNACASHLGLRASDAVSRSGSGGLRPLAASHGFASRDALHARASTLPRHVLNGLPDSLRACARVPCPAAG